MRPSWFPSSVSLVPTGSSPLIAARSRCSRSSSRSPKAEVRSECSRLRRSSRRFASGSSPVTFAPFEEVESELEELDATVISKTPTRDVSAELGKLVGMRRRIGTLRRALAPHREVVVLLAHPELDALSTEESAQRFADLEGRVARALDAARETKESTFGTFDLLDARIGQRTNDIMKVLTLGTVILLPATVLGGIMGMYFRVGLFENAALFWAVLAMMILIAVLVLAAARVRHWI